MIGTVIFEERLTEVTQLIELIPDKPNSGNVELTNAISRAAVILLCSHFEGVLQDMMEEFVTILNELEIKYNKICTSIKVQDKFPKGKINNSNFEMICSIFSELEMRVGSNPIVFLNKENFNKTDANPTPDTINSMFKYIGEEEILTKLNRDILGINNKKVKQPFLNKTEVEKLKIQLDETQISYIEAILRENRGKIKKENNIGFYNEINTLLEYRNSIVHGNKDRKISKIKLIEIKESIETIVEELIKTLNTKISEYKAIKEIECVDEAVAATL